MDIKKKLAGNCQLFVSWFKDWIGVIFLICMEIFYFL